MVTIIISLSFYRLFAQGFMNFLWKFCEISPSASNQKEVHSNNSGRWTTQVRKSSTQKNVKTQKGWLYMAGTRYLVSGMRMGQSGSAGYQAPKQHPTLSQAQQGLKWKML